MACHYIISILVIAAIAAITCDAEEPLGLTTRVNRAWAGGMQGIVDIPVTVNVTGGWHMKIDFRHNVFKLDASCWADVAELYVYENGDRDRSMVVLKNPDHAPDLLEGTNLKFYFLAKTWKRRKGFFGDITFFNAAYSAGSY